MHVKTQKCTSCLEDNEQNNVHNINEIKGNTDFVKVVFLKVSLPIFRNWVSFEPKAC